MVQGLGFLSKKSWHTKNIANQEKVWMAEEREKAEKVKTAELAKQIQQEREEDELRRVTGTGKSLDRGIAWLYDGHKKDSETAKEDSAKQAEEYLLGKPIASSTNVAGDFDSAQQAHEGVNVVLETVAGKANDEEGDSVFHRNEAFRIRHEDPMYAVSLQSVRQEKAVEHRKDLYERAGIQVDTVRRDDEPHDKEESRAKKRKSKDKKRRKSEKKHRKRRERSDSRDDESRRHKKRRHRSRSSESSDRMRRRRRTRSRSYDSSCDSRDERWRRRRRSRSVSESRRRRHYRSRSHEVDDGERHRRFEEEERRRRFGEDRKHYETDEFGRKLKPVDRSHGQHPDAPKRVEGYGLQGPADSRRPLASGQHLGPDPELLRAKRAARETERHERIDRTSSRRYKSSAEREEARRAMERDASKRAASRGNLKRPEDHDVEERSRGSAAFLRDATAKAHGLAGDERNLSERLHENRHRNQRLTDSFL